MHVEARLSLALNAAMAGGAQHKRLGNIKNQRAQLTPLCALHRLTQGARHSWAIAVQNPTLGVHATRNDVPKIRDVKHAVPAA